MREQNFDDVKTERDGAGGVRTAIRNKLPPRGQTPKLALGPVNHAPSFEFAHKQIKPHELASTGRTIKVYQELKLDGNNDSYEELNYENVFTKELESGDKSNLTTLRAQLEIQKTEEDRTLSAGSPRRSLQADDSPEHSNKEFPIKVGNVSQTGLNSSMAAGGEMFSVNSSCVFDSSKPMTPVMAHSSMIMPFGRASATPSQDFRLPETAHNQSNDMTVIANKSTTSQGATDSMRSTGMGYVRSTHTADQGPEYFNRGDPVYKTVIIL